MLIEIRIENFILIESLNLSLDKGLNVFTGETGAGKSMIIGAINAGLGGKVSGDLIRVGAKKAVVQLVFVIEDPSIRSSLDDMGIVLDDDLLIITREILPSNRSVIRLNDRVITISTLKDLSDLLIDIHGQHEHQSLLYPKNHLKYLDLMGGYDHQDLILQVQTLYGEIKRLKSEIEKLAGSESGDINYLKFQLQEIDALNLTGDDEKHLEEKYEYYKHLEQIFQNTQGISEILSGDNSSNVKEMLQTATRLLGDISSYDDKLEGYSNQLNEVVYMIDDLQSEFRHYLDGLDVDEQEMFETEERMNAVNELKLKYGKTVHDILEKRDDLSQRLDIALRQDEILAGLNQEILKAKRAYIDQSKQLQESRHALKDLFIPQVVKELSVLNMGTCQFEIAFVEKKLPDGEYRLSPNGFDEIEFMISTNPGMPVKPLSKVASGGEISRIMLAIKIALSNHDVISTLVFDEVDTGISGNTAIVVGEKIHEITSNYQVLCITHLPQIAVMGRRHFLIQKDLGQTDVVELNEDDRLSEIARMLSGMSTSHTSRQNAKEMLEKASLSMQKMESNNVKK
ncbi:DNA repair protein RecN [Acidaminobacter sp. JC074]|uniref:DNA repair protein RecN n=1 Tax=Acidaminobacter sp. JC074 TaxID=2530199 RepID=UPI001F0E0E45|nr:DNA repair protein RecN [Acidaminobacter sp. JC074]MCH4888830.1 DNA repair protein RecN [Acidaminobacter sp. JC074]